MASEISLCLCYYPAVAPYRHRVLYGDTDQMGVVYYATYLRFFEGARGEWIRELGLTYAQIEERGIYLPVLEAGVRYLKPARYDDVLEIPLRVSHTRVPHRARLHHQGRPSDPRARLAGGGDEGRGDGWPDASGGVRTMMDRNIGLEAVRLTEAAAMASARLMGRGDEKAADQAAVDAMRKAFNALHIRGTIVIGEGERDEAPMLYIGEKVGRGAADDPEVDIALDPLEGTTITATGGPNALSVIAMAEKGNLLNAPDTYMDKIAVGSSGAGAIDLRKPPTQNLRAIADRKGVYVEDLTVIILNRPRHEKLIAEVRASGARIKLIGDGDVSAAIATCFIETGVDVLMGIGGAPEGVIAAAALRCCGGDMQGKLAFRNEKEIERARKMGIADPNKIYTVEEMAKGPVIFAATGVTSGDFLKGVRFFKGGAATQSVAMRSKSHTIRYLETTHFFEHKPNFAL